MPASNADRTRSLSRACARSVAPLGLGSHRDDVFGVAQRGGGVFGKVPYSSAKAAILGFTKSLARNWKTPA